MRGLRIGTQENWGPVAPGEEILSSQRADWLWMQGAGVLSRFGMRVAAVLLYGVVLNN